MRLEQVGERGEDVVEGIRVVLVEPAYTRTAFDRNLVTPDAPLAVYDAARAGQERLMRDVMVVADAPGSKELVQDGITGYLIEAGKPHRWANAITELIYKPELRARIANNAVEAVKRSGTLTWRHATQLSLS